jgi:hypothetical protein
VLTIGVAFPMTTVSIVVASLAGPVPAVYMFGDSLADIRNNHLMMAIKVDFLPYNIDYPARKATGRFSNGKNFPDFVGAYDSSSREISGLHTSLTEWVVKHNNYKKKKKIKSSFL